MLKFNARQLKENARISIKRNFWMLLLVYYLSYGIFASKNNGFVIGTFIFSMIPFLIPSTIVPFFMGTEDLPYVLSAIVIILFSLFIVFTIFFLASTFLSAPVLVGECRYFRMNQKINPNFGELFYSFSSNYSNIYKVMFSANVRIFGMTCLFIVPGIIKYYQYMFVPYILASNPKINAKRAREISSKMTDGLKGEIFLLQLSFIGWWFLVVLASTIISVITCGLLAILGYILSLVLSVVLSIYIDSTNSELYESLRLQAIARGIATPEELSEC